MVKAGACAYGVDLSPESLSQTSEHLASHGLPHGETRVADAEALPYAMLF